MKKVKKIIKNNSKFCIGIIIGIVLSSISVYAASTINASNVSYSNSSSGLSSTTVKGAIDELAKKAKTHCPTGYDCSKIMCKRATTLHTHSCTSSSSTTCNTDATSIEIGNLGTDGILAAGDAFDCDVNGDGVYNSSTERFYYMTDLESDDNYAILMYYNNVSGGVASNKTTYAYSASGGWYGPSTAMKNLPTTTQWSGITLDNSKRQLYTYSGETSITYTYYHYSQYSNTETIEKRTTPLYSVDYSAYSARIPTYQEIVKTCPSLKSEDCIYLIENTSYFDSSFVSGYWLENPFNHTGSGYNLANASFLKGGTSFFIDTVSVSTDNYFGVRPVIEVLKSNISY